MSMFILLSIIQLSVLLQTNTVLLYAVDIHNPNTINTIAFGSCHKSKSVKKYDSTLIWDGIRSINPDTFLWLGKIHSI